MCLGDRKSYCSCCEILLENFCELYHLKSLIKTPTCFKSNENPTCIDLILTNRQQSFQNSTTIETGLSDFHHLTVTVMKTKFKKLPPKKILYRDNKNYNSVDFCNDVIAPTFPTRHQAPFCPISSDSWLLSTECRLRIRAWWINHQHT